jgi:clan AA aspartic protease
MIIGGLNKSKDMGLVYADVELINSEDTLLAKRHLIGEEEIKRTRISILVDTGAVFLAINENIQEQLRLPVLGVEKARLANNHIVECEIVGPVELRFKNRKTICTALVLPDDSEPLLGAIPLEAIDVLIDARRQELIVNPDHPDMAEVRI